MRRAVGKLTIWTVSLAIGLAMALTPPACTWSSRCTNGRITTESLPDATLGQAYTLQLTQSCGNSDAVSWQVASDQSHQPPPGITLSWDGRLSGTPTTAGNYFFSVSLSLTSRGWGATTIPVGSDARDYTLTVQP